MTIEGCGNPSMFSPQASQNYSLWKSCSSSKKAVGIHKKSTSNISGKKRKAEVLADFRELEESEIKRLKHHDEDKHEECMAFLKLQRMKTAAEKHVLKWKWPNTIKYQS
jgi:hypothetical protein